MFFTLSQESKENENILFLSSPASFPSAQTLTQWLELPRPYTAGSECGCGGVRIYVSGCFAHMCNCTHRGQNNTLGSLILELETVVSHRSSDVRAWSELWPVSSDVSSESPSAPDSSAICWFCSLRQSWAGLDYKMMLCYLCLALCGTGNQTQGQGFVHSVMTTSSVQHPFSL